MAMISIFDKFVIIVCLVFYQFSIFYDVASYMNLPIFTVVKNVYIDGVFDLCHVGWIIFPTRFECSFCVFYSSELVGLTFLSRA
jgi:hypothetical protein